MSDWDFYLCRVDQRPASFMVDLGLAATAPRADLPMVAVLRVRMNQPREDGLSSGDEYTALGKLEDAVIPRIIAGTGGLYAGRCTTAGNRDFYFYMPESAPFADIVRAAKAPFSDYRFQVSTTPDPGWERYRDFLYPERDELQRMMNRRVLDALARENDCSSEPRPIDHRVFLPNAQAEEAFTSRLLAWDFELTGRQATDEGGVAVDFRRVDRPDGIDTITIMLANAAEAFGGDYDGWGCPVVSATG